MDDLTQEEVDLETQRWARVYAAKRAFSPAAPINSTDLFSGRVAEMRRVMELMAQRGLHGAIYGERGVGKTSLAIVCSAILKSTQGVSCWRVSCSRTDTFTSVWRNALRGAGVRSSSPRVGFTDEENTTIIRADDFLPQEGELTPEDVRRALSVLSEEGEVVFFIDEFDTLPDDTTKALFADTLKALADYGVPATVVIVGVADAVDELVAQHRSIERGLAQILMPRMSEGECADIVRRGLESLEMEIEEDALEGIVKLSQGLPSCTHLLAQGSAESAAWEDRDEVTFEDFQRAIESAIQNMQQTIKDDYHKATSSPKKNALYGDVLRACALAKKDDLGYFRPADVREPLSEVTGKNYGIPSFQQHLNAFITPSRANVLHRKGESRRYRYRFRNPLLQPYVVMKGIRDDARAESERVDH